MKLQVPIKSAKYFGWQHVLKDLGDFKKCISQKFGENPDVYAWLGIQGHNGWDIPYDNGTEVYASHDGIATFEQDSGSGLGVVAVGQGLKTIYWHFKSAVRPLGQSWEVKQGDLIGYGDNTGFSTGSHLHWGIKLLDDNGNVLNRENGYDGAVDPATFELIWWNNMTETEVRKIYALAFYRLPDTTELSYWVGKSLSLFLETAIKDRAAFLQNQ